MKNAIILVAALLGLPVPFAAAQAGKPVRVILVGDSTMATRSGYGDALCQRFRPEVACINLARGGRSSGSFRAEGRWDEVEKLLRDGAAFSASYVLIQFGHNDQPGKPGRSTDLVTQFPANLERYVTEAAGLGGVPVLVTPLTRRSFKGPYLRDDLAPWADAARKVAVRKKVALLDLNRLSADAVQAMGSAEADTLAQEPPPSPVAAADTASSNPPANTPANKTANTSADKAANKPANPSGRTSAGTSATTRAGTSANASAIASGAAVEPQGPPKSAFDRTHVGPKGAALFSGMVASELRHLFPSLAQQFKPEP